MSALSIMVARLSANADVVAQTAGGQIYAGSPPQDVVGPRISIRLIYESSFDIMSGASRFYRSRVQINCEAPLISGAMSGAAAANNLGEAVKLALEDTVKATVDGFTNVDVWKEGSDVTIPNDARDMEMRILDFYCTWKS
jgi:hypothetical protein